MKFYRLFGNNIEPNCDFCDNCEKADDIIKICKAKKEIINGKCRGFKYNPLLRVPTQVSNLPKYDPKDFEL